LNTVRTNTPSDEVLALADELQPLDVVLLQGLGEGRPVGLPEDVVGRGVHDGVADLLQPGLDPLGLDGRGLQVAIEHAGAGRGVGELLVDHHIGADLVEVRRVGNGLDRAGFDRIASCQAGLVRRDREPGDVDEATGGADLGPEVVLHRTGTDDAEVLVTGLLQDRLVLGDRGVAQVQRQLLAVDAARGVAPLDEGRARIEDLLVEAGPALEAGIGDGAHGDGVLGDALGLGWIRGHGATARVGPADPGEVTEVPCAAAGRGLGGLGGRAVGAPRFVLAPVATAAGGDQRPDGDDRDEQSTCLHVPPL
jgi:hypothetical protein